MWYDYTIKITSRLIKSSQTVNQRPIGWEENDMESKYKTEFTISTGKRFATDGKGHYWTSSNSTGEMMPTTRANYSTGLMIWKQENKEG